jgi:hypothetical protein
MRDKRALWELDVTRNVEQINNFKKIKAGE